MNPTPFADKDTSQMLKDMGFIGSLYTVQSGRRPIPPGYIWEEIEEWLWEKERIYVKTSQLGTGDFDLEIMQGCQVLHRVYRERSYSIIPIRVEGIRTAVKYKWEQQFKKEGK